MRTRREPKHPESEVLLGTLEGFFKDMPVAVTYHGIRALMKKHFPVICESFGQLAVKADNETQLSFTMSEMPSEATVHGRNGGRRHLLDTRWECWLEKSGKKTLIWYQEKRGNEFADAPVIVIPELCS